jgi:hypothetical protein
MRSLIVYLGPDVVVLLHGDVRVRGHAHARRRGQVFGTQIPPSSRTLTLTITVGAPVVGIVRPTFVALAMTTLGRRHDLPT